MRVPAHIRVDGTRILSAEDFEKIKQLKQHVADGETLVSCVLVMFPAADELESREHMKSSGYRHEKISSHDNC